MVISLFLRPEKYYENHVNRLFIMNCFRKYHIELILVSIGVLYFWAYWPAAFGPFLFDDMGNLGALQKNGGITNLESWLDFVLGGHSSPIGRPLALASFTLNAQNWPADPFYFKLTNIFIHGLNSYLVYKLTAQIIQLNKNILAKKFAVYLPLFISAVWLFHPIHLTTILQVVQRMTLMSGTFILSSLILYIRFLRNHEFKPNKNFLILTVQLIILGGLGVLSKEIAILLPFYIFCINLLVVQKEPFRTNSFFLYWNRLNFLTPIIILLILTAYYHPSINDAWSIREFNLSQRLLTEIRIIWDYTIKLIAPQMGGAGLFHDNIEISNGLLNPFSTLLSLIFLVVLVFIAVKVRKKNPYITACISWFLLGHSLESTSLPLELYFEHRNYIPSLCLVFLILHIYQHTEEKYFFSGMFLYTTLTTFVLFLSTPIWKDQVLLYTTWAAENPKSVRAQQSAAMVWLYYKKDPIKARDFLRVAIANSENTTSARLRLLEINCNFNPALDNLHDLIAPLHKTRFEWGSISAIATIIDHKSKKHCKSVSYNLLNKALDKLIENKMFTLETTREALFILKSRTLLALNKPERALEFAYRAQNIQNYLGTIILKLEIASKLKDQNLIAKFIKEAEERKSQYSENISPEQEHFYHNFHLKTQEQSEPSSERH